MRKKKILHFDIENSRGGVTRYVMQNWKYIDKEKFQFDFISLDDKLDFEDDLKMQGCTIYHRKYMAKDNFIAFKKEIRDIFNHNYDIIQLHTGFWKGTVMEEIAHELKIPRIIVHSHNTAMGCIPDTIGFEEKRALHEKIKSEIDLNFATDFWACSRAAADWLFGEQISRSKIKIMKNAIEVENFIYNENKRNDIRNMLGIADKFVIGHVGRFDYQKNHEFLVNVFKEVYRYNENVQLLLVGIGHDFDKIKDLVHRYKIDNAVTFLGIRDDVEDIMQAMDIFCLPSRFEGLPIVAVEAQASGLKCVLSDTITDEVCITDNVLMLPLDENKWVDVITGLLKGYSRENMYNQITSAGYNIKYAVKEIENGYDN